jgi:hypothetical protein
MPELTGWYRTGKSRAKGVWWRDRYATHNQRSMVAKAQVTPRTIPRTSSKTHAASLRVYERHLELHPRMGRGYASKRKPS